MTLIDFTLGLGLTSPLLFGGLLITWLKLRTANNQLLSLKLAHSKLQLVHYCAMTDEQ